MANFNSVYPEPADSPSASSEYGAVSGVQLKNHHLLVLILQTALETTYHAKLPQVNEEPEARLRALASAVCVSPLWGEMPRAVLVIRLGSDPSLSVVGYFDDASRTRLEWLRWQLDHVMSRLRYVGYA